MSKKINISDKKIRYAMWCAHDRRSVHELCASGKSLPVLFHEAYHIDHIIPRATFKTDSQGIKKKLGLDETFNFEGLENLVICKAYENLSKSDKVNCNFVRKLLREAKIKKSLIEKELEKLNDEGVTDEELVSRAKKIDEDPERSDLTHNFCTKNDPFEEIDKELTNSYLVQKPNVLLHLIYPGSGESNSLEGSALITFRTTRMLKALISLNSQELLRSFKGYSASATSTERGYFVGMDVGDPSFGYVEFSGTRFSLNIEELKEVAFIIDKACQKYLEKAFEVEKRWKTAAFKYIGDNQFALCRIPYWLWQDVLDFCKEYGSSKGTTKWHVFEAKQGYLDTSMLEYLRCGLSGQCALYPREISDSILFGRSSYIHICWQYPVDKISDSLKFADAEDSCKWFVEVLLPEVWRWKYSTRLKSFFDFILGNEPFKFDLALVERDSENRFSSRVKDRQTLLDYIIAIQMYASSSRRLYCSDRIGEELIVALKFLIETCRPSFSTREYIISKLELEYGESKDVISACERLGQHINRKGKIDMPWVDWLLRCILLTIEDSKSGFDDETSRSWLFEYLQETVQHFDKELYRKRLLD